MAYATPADVALELGRPATSDIETAQWQAWLNRVERSIARRFAKIDKVLATQVTAGDPALADVKDVEVAAVLRKIANPTGMTSVTRSVDDASITTRRDGRGDVDPLALTDEEWAALLPDVTSSGAFTVDTVGGVSVHADICALRFGSLYCSCGADLTNYAYPLFEV